MKRKIPLCFALVLILSVLLIPNLSASAAGNISWSVEDGVLTITGTGYIGHYGFASSRSDYTTTVPWEDYENEITSVVVGEGITYIGNLAFHYLNNLTEITLPSTLTGYSLGDNEPTVYSAFSFSQNQLKRINWNGTLDQWIRVQNRCASYYWGAEGSSNLMYCSPDLYVNGNLLTEAMLNADSPSLARDAFYNCKDLTTLTVEDGYSGSIGIYAFQGCQNLQTINFEGDAPNIDAYAFGGITATVNYIPYASWEGKVQSYGGNLTWVEQGVTTRGLWGDNLSWKLMEDGTLSITGEGEMDDFPVGSTEAWSALKDNILAVDIGNGVTSIGSRAFSDCDNLETISVPASIVNIGTEAFYGCNNLTSLTLHEGLESIGEHAFHGCALTELSLPDGVETIGICAFMGTNLTSISIPVSVTAIGLQAFYDCSNLTDVYYAGTLAQWNAIDFGQNNYYLLRATLHCNGIASGVWGSLDWFLDNDGVLTISGTGAIQDIIQPSYNDRPAWWACADEILSVVIENGVTAIGKDAFNSCENLTDVTIPSSVRTIDNYAFSNCGSLSSITIPAEVTRIGTSAFNGCNGLRDVYYGGSRAGWAAIYIGSGNAVLSGDTIHYAYYDILVDTGITNGSVSVKVNGSYKRIAVEGDTVVLTATPDPGYDLATLTVRQGNTNVQVTSNQFRMPAGDVTVTATFAVQPVASGTCGTNLTWRLDENGTLTISGTGAMTDYSYAVGNNWNGQASRIKSVVVGSGVTSIGQWAFYNCSAIESVTVASSVKTIGDHCFEGCASLSSIVLPVGVETISYGAFRFCYALESLVLPDGLKELGNDSLHNCTGLTHLVIPASVTTIWDQTLSGCTRIKTAGPIGSGCDLEFGWTYALPRYAFAYLPALESAVLPDSISSISEGAFDWCSALKSVSFSRNVSSVGNYAFYYCDKLTDVYYNGTQAQWDAMTIGSNNYRLTNAAKHFNPSASGTIGNLSWQLKDGVLTISGSGAMNLPLDKNYWYPYRENINSLILESGVTSIDESAFSGCSNLTEVSIPGSVTIIGDGAFNSCYSLTGVSIPAGVTTIGEGAFAFCSDLKDLALPNTLGSIGVRAFYNCYRLDNVAIPSNVTGIGNNAFEYTGLTSVSIPARVSSIGTAAFSNCQNLSAITVAAGNTVYSSDSSGVLYNKNKTRLMQAPGGLSGSFVIPGTVQNIDNYAFYGCGLTDVTIPSGVTSIGSCVFTFCRNLASVSIPVSVTEIGYAAFNYTGLTDVYYSGTQTQWNAVTIGSYNSPLTQAKLHAILDSGVHGALRWSLDTAGLLTITGEGNMSSFTYASTDAWLAYRNRISRVVIGSGVTSVGEYAFYSCTSLREASIPNSVIDIGKYAFNNCTKLTDLTIPNRLTSIGEYAFLSCESLTSVTIPSSVTSIGQFAFEACKSLDAIVVAEGNPSYSSDDSGVLFNKNKTELLQAPGNLTGLYSIPATVTDIENMAFYDCGELTGIVIPESVTDIGYGAFAYCSKLTGVEIPKGVTNIAEGLFMNCSALAEVAIPVGVEMISNNAFYECRELKSIVIPDGVTSVGYSAFASCYKLKSITVPASLTSIHQSAFEGCASTSAGPIGGAFDFQYGWTEAIPDEAFCWVQSLESITIPSSVTSIGRGAVYGCSNLTDIYYDGIAAQWNSITINNDNGPIDDAAIHCTKAAVTFDADNGTENVTVAVVKGEKAAKPEDPTKENHSFLGWFAPEATEAFDFENTAINEDLTLTAHWAHTYTVTYNANNGTGAPEAQPKIQGETLTLSSTVPSREGYDFQGWATSATATAAEYQAGGSFTVDADTTLYAVWKVKTYTITWKNDDDSVIDTTTVEYGEVPTHADATKAATDEYTYTFASWTPEVVAVTGEATYKATYTETVNKYSVTFVDEDDETVLLAAAQYDYGTAASDIVKPADPTKEATAQYSYTFAGWTPEVVTVTGNATYKATYTETVNKYSVTFVDEDGETVLLAAAQYDYGTAASDIVKPADPTKEATAQYTYTFAGWTPEVVAVTGNATYKATYTETVNKYSVTFVDEDGETVLLAAAQYDYGTAAADIVRPADPTKEATTQYSYSFAGWTPEVAEVTGNATYKATYTETVNSYTVSWLNDDASEIDTTTVEYGKTPTHADATKAATEEYTYTFLGWQDTATSAIYSGTLPTVTGPVTYKAYFISSVNRYTIRFVDEDGTELQSDTITYGRMPKYDGETPTKDATAEYTYTFAGWTPEIEAVTSDTTYTATFTAAKNSYPVTWLNDDASEIDTTTVEYGIVPPHADASMAATEEYTYTFLGWQDTATNAIYSGTLPKVTGPVTYKAYFISSVNKYTIMFVDEDGTELQSGSVTYGRIPKYDGETPTKEATAEYTYTFAGWTPEVVVVTGEATYKATFTATKRSYTITWKNDDDTVIDTTTVEYGKTPTHANPTKAATSEYTYTFVGWTPEVMAVTGETTYKATFTVTPVFGTPIFKLPTAIKTIEESAFEGLPMTIVEIPNGCESIGKWAFKDCTSLTQIRIPASVTFIDDMAFDGCANVFIFGATNSAAKTFCDTHANCTFVAEDTST